MRWRFVDRVDRFEPWTAIAARKAVSFEEYSLHKPFGRKGVFPESLIVECCVETVRWLVAASSGFARVSVLAQIDDFHFESEAGMGSLLEIAATVEHRATDELGVKCTVAAGDGHIAAGRISAGMIPLDKSFDPELVEGMWRELYCLSG